MRRFFKSLHFAIQGVKIGVKGEMNLKIHLSMVLLTTLCGILFCISYTEWLLCLVCFGMVVSAELVNSAIETVVDLISPNHHPLAKRAKDIAAGAVLITAITSAIIGLMIFVPKGVATAATGILPILR